MPLHPLSAPLQFISSTTTRMTFQNANLIMSFPLFKCSMLLHFTLVETKILTMTFKKLNGLTLPTSFSLISFQPPGLWHEPLSLSLCPSFYRALNTQWLKTQVLKSYYLSPQTGSANILADLSFPISKVGEMIIPTSWGFCEVWMKYV